MTQPAHRPIARRRRRSPVAFTALLAIGIGVAGTTGVLRAADQRTAEIGRIDGLEEVLADANDLPAENYLLVGSDTREGADPSSPDAGGIGDSSAVTGRRSDTIMILRRERNGGAALVSIPRDLWVEIAGTGSSGRINSAYNEGAQRLAATVTQSLGIPIHHYVEVDFFGFKDIIDEIGGVEICSFNSARDKNTGLQLDPGCQTLDGIQALAYARSRYYEEFRDGDWHKDGTADLGRIERQQYFMVQAAAGILNRLKSSPFSTGDMIQAVSSSVRIDRALDPFAAADALRAAVSEGLVTYRLPVEGRTIDGNSVLELSGGADPILAYFRGEGPAPDAGL